MISNILFFLIILFDIKYSFSPNNTFWYQIFFSSWWYFLISNILQYWIKKIRKGWNRSYEPARHPYPPPRQHLQHHLHQFTKGFIVSAVFSDNPWRPIAIDCKRPNVWLLWRCGCSPAYSLSLLHFLSELRMFFFSFLFVLLPQFLSEVQMFFFNVFCSSVFLSFFF